MTEKKSKTKKAVLFISRNRFIRQAYVEDLINYCHKKHLDIVKVFECSESDRLYQKTFNEMNNYIKSQQHPISVVIHNTNQLMLTINNSLKIARLYHKHQTEFCFYKEGLIINQKSKYADISKSGLSHCVYACV